jgi:hypothetical protein
MARLAAHDALLQGALPSRMEKLLYGYAGHDNEVAAVVDQCEQAIEAHKGEVGEWGAELLEEARTALAGGWLRLALVEAGKALEVNTLPEKEYNYGFAYGRGRS